MNDEKRNGKNTNDPSLRHLDMETVNAASATDFTGFIPANPQIAEEERDAYESIHDFGSEGNKKRA